MKHARGAHRRPARSTVVLDEYRRKRDPARTVEPFSPERRVSAAATVHGRFVVHLHDATRRHYDLRLQVGGALACLALPRGPSLDPADKRLAVPTEPHPLEYFDFEDVIAAGNYGAGPMIAWDAGSVVYRERSAEEGLRRGDLKFDLVGHKLRGSFALVETSSRGGRPTANEKIPWLLLKKKDAHSMAGYRVTEDRPLSVLSGLTVEQLDQKRAIADDVLRRAVDHGAPRGLVDATRLAPML